MKHKIYKRYRKGKRGGQRYWVGRKLRKNYGSHLFRESFLPKKGVAIYTENKQDKKVIGEIFRKNPELLTLKGDIPIDVMVFNKKYQDEYGILRGGASGETRQSEGKSRLVALNKSLLQTDRSPRTYDLAYKNVEETVPHLNPVYLSTKIVNKVKVPGRVTLPGVLAHELTHVNQSGRFKSYEEFAKEYSKDAPIAVPIGTFPKDSEEYQIQQKLHDFYKNNPFEKEAKEQEKKIEEKRKHGKKNNI